MRKKIFVIVTSAPPEKKLKKNTTQVNCVGDIITNAIPVYKGEGTLSPWNQPNPLHAETHLSLGCRICHWQRIESGTPSNDYPSLADLYPSMP